MNWLDGIIMAIAVILGLLGWKIGLFRAIFLAGGIVLAAILGAQISGPLAGWLTDSVDSDALASVIAYGIVILLVFVGAQLAGAMVGRVLRMLFLGWIDGLGGAALGVGAGLVIGGVLIAVLARLAFLVGPTPIEKISQIEVRERLQDALVGSKLVPGYLDAKDALPGSTLGMIPADYKKAMDVLEKVREERGQDSQQTR